MARALPSFEKFQLNGDSATNLGPRWIHYVKKLENLFVAMNIESKKRKKALLLHYAGDEVFEIHATLDNTGNENDYAASKTALENYFKPQLNTEFQVFEYRQMKQNQSETIDEFATRLRQKAVYCDFTNKDRELKSQLIQGCKSQKLKRKILQENLDLPNILLTARQMELANEQAGKMVGTSASEDAYATNAVRNKKNRERKHRQPQRQPPSAPSGSRDTDRRKTEKCRNCGGTFPHKTGQCPAKGKTCNYCHKQNHFVVVCMKKKRKEQRIKQVRDNSNQDSSNDDSEIESDAQSTDSEHAFGIQINKIRTKQPKVDISVNGRKCRMLVDTGSTINLLNETILNKMKTKPTLSKPDTDAYAYGQKRKLPIKGKFTGTVETSNKITTAMFYVINGNYDSLISYETSVELGLVPEINSVTLNSVKDSGNVKNLINEYSGLFEGIGKLKDKEIKLHIDESVPPVAQPHRRIPFHMREKVEKELQRLEQLDIIEKVDGPTEWFAQDLVTECWDSNWTKYLEKCYLVVSFKHSWAKANDYCSKYGAKLAEPAGITVNGEVASGFHEDYWIGYNLIDISPSESYKGRWSDGRLTSVIAGVWGQNQPNPESGKCTYVEASDTEKLWYTADCERVMPFVCEMNPCPQGMFQCSGRCIDPSHVCDGSSDCGDNRDEADCSSSCTYHYTGTQGTINQETTQNRYEPNKTCQ